MRHLFVCEFEQLQNPGDWTGTDRLTSSLSALQVVALLTEPTEVTGLEAHSVRGFLSGTVKKKLGLHLEASQDGTGARRYIGREPKRPRQVRRFSTMRDRPRRGQRCR